MPLFFQLPQPAVFPSHPLCASCISCTANSELPRPLYRSVAHIIAGPESSDVSSRVPVAFIRAWNLGGNSSRGDGSRFHGRQGGTSTLVLEKYSVPLSNRLHRWWDPLRFSPFHVVLHLQRRHLTSRPSPNCLVGRGVQLPQPGQLDISCGTETSC